MAFPKAKHIQRLHLPGGTLIYHVFTELLPVEKKTIKAIILFKKPNWVLVGQHLTFLPIYVTSVVIPEDCF